MPPQLIRKIVLTVESAIIKKMILFADTIDLSINLMSFDVLDDL